MKVKDVILSSKIIKVNLTPTALVITILAPESTVIWLNNQKFSSLRVDSIIIKTTINSILTYNFSWSI